MIEFMAALNKVTRDNEDCTKLVLECDCQQIEAINQIPAQKLLKVKITVEE